RLLFLLILVAHNVAGVGRRNPQHLLFHIGDKFAALNLRKGDLDSFFVLDLVVLALSRNAPAAKSRDFSMRIERDANDAVLAAARAQNLVDDAHPCLDLVQGLDSDRVLGIEEDGVGFVVVSGKWCRSSGMHPGWSIP